MSNKLNIIFGIIIMVACNPKPEPLFFKKIKTKNFELNWYYFSYLSNESPDIIDMKRGEETYNICKSPNIYDVNIFGEDSVLITFIDSPKFAEGNNLLVNQLFNIPIRIDSIPNSKFYKSKPFFKE